MRTRTAEHAALRIVVLPAGVAAAVALVTRPIVINAGVVLVQVLTSPLRDQRVAGHVAAVGLFVLANLANHVAEGWPHDGVALHSLHRTQVVGPALVRLFTLLPVVGHLLQRADEQRRQLVAFEARNTFAGFPQPAVHLQSVFQVVCFEDPFEPGVTCGLRLLGQVGRRLGQPR